MEEEIRNFLIALLALFIGVFLLFIPTKNALAIYFGKSFGLLMLIIVPIASSVPLLSITIQNLYLFIPIYLIAVNLWLFLAKDVIIRIKDGGQEREKAFRAVKVLWSYLMIIFIFIIAFMIFFLPALIPDSNALEIINKEPIESTEKCDICIIEQEPNIFDWVDFFSNLLGVISGVGTIYGFYVAKKRGLRKRIVNSIIIELNENKKRKPANEANRLRGRVFVTYAFDSAVNSGDFSHFKLETQVKLSPIYQEMKLYNQYLNNLNLAYELAEIQKLDVSFYTPGVEKLIMSLRKEILKDIPKIIKIVEKETPKYFIL